MGERRWMVYGANGYTGRLIAERAAGEGDAPLLAGRREGPVRALAERLGLEWRVFPLGRPERVAEQLGDVDLVLHCAGPFSATSRSMVEGCLRAGAHYLDITGEISVFEEVLGSNARAERAGVVLLPGAGFDVVPSDCLAASLAARLPGANRLELAFWTRGGETSPGTMKTMVENMPRGGRVRRDGKIIKVPTAHRAKRIPFTAGVRKAVAIPWGDVSTAYYSTGIPNITVYLVQPGSAIAFLKLTSPIAPVLGAPRLQRFLKRRIDRWVKGPSAEVRQRARVHLWGRVTTPRGDSLEGTLDVREGYTFTVDAALACTERVLAGEVAPGSWTPSRAFGADFVTTLPETELVIPAQKGSETLEPARTS